VVEQLGAQGDAAVKDTVWASLIEWFGLGEPDEQAALRDAASLQGPATKRIVAQYVLQDK
jgi:hypothetical protein